MSRPSLILTRKRDPLTKSSFTLSVLLKKSNPSSTPAELRLTYTFLKLISTTSMVALLTSKDCDTVKSLLADLKAKNFINLVSDV